VTASGLLQRRFLLFVLPVVGLIGLATGATALLGLAGGGLVLLMLARLDAYRRLLGLRASREVYTSAFEDDPVRVRVSLENRSRRDAWLVELVDSFGPSLSDRQALLAGGPLLPRRRRTLAYRALCSRTWGEYRVGPLGVATSDALGLFRARRSFFQIETFTVFPRVHPVAALDRLGARPTAATHDHSAPRAGQSLAYLGVRDYRPGDDVRRIHWPATARRGALTVKEYERDLLPYFTLFLDLDRRGRAGTGRKSTLEFLVRTAASVLWTAATRGDVVQVIAEGAHPLLVPPGRGGLHATQCLYELVRVRQEGSLDLFDLVERHSTNVPEGSAVALLLARLGFDLARLEAALFELRARAAQPAVLVVNDASFLPVDRWPMPPMEVQERKDAIAALLAIHGVPGRILEASQDLAVELGRSDLLGDAA
jgi:uncharacterized protein (DUF58 family)